MPDPVPIDPSSSGEGMPMVKTTLSGFEILSSVTVAQAQLLLGIAGGSAASMNQLLISMGFVGSIISTGATLLKPYCVWPAGQDLDRGTYSLLFGVYGTQYGASSGTTFKVPDLRGRSMFGYDGFNPSGRVSSAFNTAIFATAGGAELIALTAAQLPPHIHDMAHNHQGVSGEDYHMRVTSGGTNDIVYQAGNTHYVENVTGLPNPPNTGDGHTTGLGGSGHQNMPPGATMQFMIYAGA